MKKHYLYGFLTVFLAALIVVSCGGGGGSNNNPPDTNVEPQITITDPDIAGIIAHAEQDNGNAQMDVFGDKGTGIVTKMVGNVEDQAFEIQYNVGADDKIIIDDHYMTYSFNADGTVNYKFYINDILQFEENNVVLDSSQRTKLSTNTMLSNRLTTEECLEKRESIAFLYRAIMVESMSPTVIERTYRELLATIIIEAPALSTHIVQYKQDCMTTVSCEPPACCDDNPQICGNACIAYNSVCCADGTHCAAGGTCTPDGCCPEGNKFCNGDCVPADWVCCADGVNTCPGGNLCIPGGGCCPPNKKLCGTSCVDLNAVCCPDGGSCDAGFVCAGVGVCCPAERPVACGEFCIPSDATCCPGGGACPAGSVCTNDEICCPADAPIRCGTGCIAAGLVCCETYTCPAGTMCSSTGCTGGGARTILQQKLPKVDSSAKVQTNPLLNLQRSNNPAPFWKQ